MDMALCVLDLEKGEMEFAGAKNPLVRVGPDGVDWIKGDRRPIGGRNLGSKRQPDVPFTLHRMPLAPGCSYYLFSDGFQDQFGGEEGMKFSPKRLRELLASAHGLPIAQQRAFLEEAFEAWKGRERQIDDVMVVGFGVG
jgi:serine phosphatase RsbU (regulator of sigma subunit)